MLIVVEGVDKTGKSTLVEALAKITGGQVLHRAKPERHPLLEYEADLDTYVPGREHIICDRWHWGETVWPTIFNRPTQYTREMFLHTELFLQSRGALVILATSSEGAIVSRLDDPYPPPEKVSLALELFENAYAAARTMRVRYDFTKAPLEEELAFFLDAATKLELVVGCSWTTHHWVGDPQPQVLLVGDRPGPSDQSQWGTVPFRPFGGAGTYLMRALESVPKVALTNTHDGFWPVPLRGLWLVLGRPRVVALGDAANEALMVAEVPHGAVPHPQWVRRFHHSRLSEYPDLILRASFGTDTREETRTWRT